MKAKVDRLLLTDVIKKLLVEIDLPDVQQRIYEQLLVSRRATIDTIKEITGLSYAQVQYNLRALEQRGLIAASKGEKPRMFLAINPTTTLAAILDEKYKTWQESIARLNTELRINEQSSGSCTRRVSFYHYTDHDLAIEYYRDLIREATKEIVMSAPPPLILRRLENSLHEAFLKGIPITIFYSTLDFDSVENYMGQVLDILKRVRVTVVETREKVTQLVRFNDVVVNMGVLLIDGVFLNSIVFKDDVVYHADGFYGQAFVEQAKRFLDILTVEKRITENPVPVRSVLDAIANQGFAKTRDIGTASGISGETLRKILDYLVEQGMIAEEIVRTGQAGRPKKVYQVVES